MISIFTADQVEAALVVRHRLYLACEQIHSGRWLGLVRMVNIEEAVRRRPTPPLLPHSPHLALALLQQVTGSRDPVVLVALQLVQRVSRAALLRGHVLYSIKVGGASQQRL